MMVENARWIDMIRAGYRRLPGKLVNRPTVTLRAMLDLPTKLYAAGGNIVV
jgi:hypothetical protein